MFNFDGKAVTPENTLVVTYTEQKDKTGKVYKVVTNAQQFASYQEAEAFISGQPSGNFRIVGNNPMKSPVPLEPLERYKLVHSSESIVTFQEDTKFPAIKIFEYVRTER